MTGKERRWINPNKGLVKILERNLDIIVSRFLYPHLSRVWNPYSWLLERRFVLTEASVSPAGWPRQLDPLRVLLISDIHAGIFLKPQTLADLILSLMELKPDLVTIAGDIVTGHSNEVRPFLDALAPLSRAPLGAWYAYGNHDYFGGDPEDIRKDLSSIGITTLKNESVTVAHGQGRCVIGGIDDLIFGSPDWQRLLSRHGAPHLLLAHNPDQFYEAEGHGVPLTLSGHTHGGQIRFPNGPPIIRHSRFCLDEGLFSFPFFAARGVPRVGKCRAPLALGRRSRSDSDRGQARGTAPLRGQVPRARRAMTEIEEGPFVSARRRAGAAPKSPAEGHPTGGRAAICSGLMP